MQMDQETAVKQRLFAILLAIVFLAISVSEASTASRRHRQPGPLQSLLQIFQNKPAAQKRKRSTPSKSPKAVTARQAALPGVAPLPVPRPETAESEDAATAIPTPTPKPDAAAPDSEPKLQTEPEPVLPPPLPETAQQPDEDAAAPIPTPRPDVPTADAEPQPEPEPQTEPEPEPEPQAEPEPEPALPAEPPNPEQPAALPKPEKPFVQAVAPIITPEQEEACRAALKTLGVVFAESAPQSDPLGCRMDHPISVSALGPSIKLSPPGTMICPLAEAAARFSQGVIAPAAQKSFGSPLASISQASAYVCRGRHGGRKLSEHAFGNALDIAAIVLADGQRIDVKADSDPVRRDFLNEVERAACGPFKTVLGPGSDADHALHFHFDLEERRNGGAYCH